VTKWKLEKESGLKVEGTDWRKGGVSPRDEHEPSENSSSHATREKNKGGKTESPVPKPKRKGGLNARDAEEVNYVKDRLKQRNEGVGYLKKVPAKRRRKGEEGLSNSFSSMSSILRGRGPAPTIQESKKILNWGGKVFSRKKGGGCL